MADGRRPWAGILGLVVMRRAYPRGVYFGYRGDALSDTGGAGCGHEHVTTYSIAGAEFGYRLLWVVLGEQLAAPKFAERRPYRGPDPEVVVSPPDRSADRASRSARSGVAV